MDKTAIKEYLKDMKRTNEVILDFLESEYTRGQLDLIGILISRIDSGLFDNNAVLFDKKGE